jgi:hypothetical protein
VEQLDAWYGKGTDPFNEFTILRGIKIRWAGGEESPMIGHCPGDNETGVLHTSFDFENNGYDTLEWMDIYGSTGRVDSLRLVTRNERDYFEVGGVGGDKCVQRPAHGRNLHGLYGRAGSDIDKLGGIFKY